MGGAKLRFVVGRRTRKGTVVVLAGARAPIRGPWTVRAVVVAT
jgi:hypothetical protein